MKNYFKKAIYFFVLLILPLALFAQKDVTKFLGIPVDGNKSEMIQKLKSKGFTMNKYKEGVLDGEFNGENVNLHILTNNNKVWRIAVIDQYNTDEINIKVQFNKLIQQFINNERYMDFEDLVTENIIPEDEDISYEISVNEKRYEAAFYQKSLKYDSLSNEYDLLSAKDNITDEEHEKIEELIYDRTYEGIHSLNKSVWFMISNDSYNEYSITIFYDNVFNKADGSDL